MNMPPAHAWTPEHHLEVLQRFPAQTGFQR